MFVSVVIPTYQREDQLVNTISYVLSNTYSDFEVIVVDQTEKHTPVVAEALTLFRQHAKFQHIQIPIANLPLARNVGLRRAKGDIIIYIDDDVELGEDFIEAHAKCYEDPEIGAVGGRIINLHGQASDPTGNAKPGRILSDGTRTTHFYKTERAHIDWGMGCNMSFSRTALEEVNGFDERYSGAAKHEDIDAFIRVRQAGYTAIFEPSASLTHLKATAGGCRADGEQLRRARSYLRSEALFCIVSGRGFFPTIKRGLQGSLFHADQLSKSTPDLRTAKLALASKLFASFGKALIDRLLKSSSHISETHNFKI